MTDIPSELSRVVDALPALVWTARPDGHVDCLDRRWCEYTGLRASDAHGRGWEAAIHPDDLPALSDCWRSMLASGEPAELEARLRRFDGAYRWFLLRASPMVDASGRIVRWCGVSTDIEDRRRAEDERERRSLLRGDADERERAEALLAGERLLLEMVAHGHPLPEVLDALCRSAEALVSDCRCSVVLVDPTRTRLERGAAPSLPGSFIAAINGRRICTMSGPNAMAVHLGEQIVAVDLTSDDRWAASGWCTMALSHGLRACCATPIVSRSGTVLGAFALYYTVPGAPTPAEQALIAQFTHLACIAIERAHTEAALKRSETLLAEGQRLSMTGTFSWRVATDEIKWSDESYRIFELAPGTPLTIELIESRVHPEDAPTFAALVERGRRRGDDVGFEHRLLMPNGTVKYLHVAAHATRDRQGRLEYIGAIQDVTERHLREDALGQLRSALADVARVASLGALTASIAHEVNQPLAGIVTNASTCLRMLDARPADIDGARETARRTIRDGNRASEVIARLRAMFGRRETTSEQVDLNAATREVIALSMRELQTNRAVLRTALADDLPAVRGDRVQLQQVILNLLLNASEAMREVHDRPRQLSITTEPADDGVRLTVRDAGVGFDPRTANRLFDAFYTTKGSGMGIGLAISRSIIASHGGRMWAEANDGPGATFSFSIPCAPGRATSVDDPGRFWLPAATEAAQAPAMP